MAQTLHKTRVVGNPGGRRKKYRRASNPGDILGFTLAAGNPGRKGGKHMAKRAKKHASRRSGTSKYKRNTGRLSTKGRSSHRVRRYKRNAGGGMSGGIGPVLVMGVSVLAGALGSKLGAQIVLGQKNTGALGYAGNVGVGGLLWFLADKVLKNRTAANGIIAGTVVQVLLRAINDYTPFGQYVNSLGMGDYQMQSFVTPQVLVDPMGSAEIAIPNGWAPQMALPAAASPAQAMTATAGGGGNGAGMSGLYGGGWGGGLYG